MEQGTIGADKQKVAVNEKDGVNRIAELAAQFVKLRDRGLKVSTMGLSSVFRYMRYGRKAVSKARVKTPANNRQHNDEEGISGQGIKNGGRLRVSEIAGNKPAISVEQLPVLLKGNTLREPKGGEGMLRVLNAAKEFSVFTSSDTRDAKKIGEYRRQPPEESKWSHTTTGKITVAHPANTLLPTQQQRPTIAALLNVKKTGAGIERIRVMGGLRNEGEWRVAYELRTSGNPKKFHSSELPNVSRSSIVRSRGLLQSSSMLQAERGMIYRNNFMQSVKPVSLKPNFSMDGSGLSNGGKSDKVQFDLPAESAAGKGRRGIGGNGHQRSQAVKVEINQPLIGSVTIHTSRGDGGAYELRSKIEGVLMDILESVNTIG